MSEVGKKNAISQKTRSWGYGNPHQTSNAPSPKIYSALLCPSIASSYRFEEKDMPTLEAIMTDKNAPHALRSRAEWFASELGKGHFPQNDPQDEKDKTLNESRPTLACLDMDKWVEWRPNRKTEDIPEIGFAKQFHSQITPKDMNSWRAFGELAREFAQGPLQKKLAQGQKRVTILYPASGAHVGPLEAAFTLLKSNSTLEGVDFIYTEISDFVPARLKQNLTYLAEQGLIRDLKIKKPKRTKTDGTATKYTMNVVTPHGLKNIRIRLEMHCCKDSYFSKKAFTTADILLFHDLGGTYTHDAPKLSLKMAFEAAYAYGGAPKTVWMEELRDVDGINIRSLFTTEALEDYRVIRQKYGCRDNSKPLRQGGDGIKDESASNDHLGRPHFRQAASFTLDCQKLSSLSKEDMDAWITTFTIANDIGHNPSEIMILWQEKVKSGWAETERKNTDAFLKAAAHWKSIALNLRQKWGAESEWQFRKAVLTRLPQIFSMELLQQESPRNFLRETVIQTLDDPAKFDEVMGWMEGKGPKWDERSASLKGMLDFSSKSNLVSLYFWFADSLNAGHKARLEGMMRNKFLSLLGRPELRNALSFLSREGHKKVSAVDGMFMASKSDQPFFISLLPTVHGSIAHLFENIYSDTSLYLAIITAYFGRKLFGKKCAWYQWSCHQDTQTKAALDTLDKIDGIIETATAQIMVEDGGKKRPASELIREHITGRTVL